MHWSTGHSFCFDGQCKKNPFILWQGAASVDRYAPVVLNGEHFQATVRTASCEFVGKSQKCVSCKSYRHTDSRSVDTSDSVGRMDDEESSWLDTAVLPMPPTAAYT